MAVAPCPARFMKTALSQRACFYFKFSIGFPPPADLRVEAVIDLKY